MKVVLVSSSQPSVNPRLVKEADALVKAGYTVTVLYAYWNQWATKFDEQLLDQKKWTAVRIGGDPATSKWLYFQGRLIFKIAKKLFKIFPPFFVDLAIARSSYYLIKEVKKHRADLYIAHNLGALPAVIKAAAKNSTKCGFDAEDFHRNEVSNDENNSDVLIKTLLEEKYFPNLDYLCASSPLIASAYNNLFPKLTPEVILNVFPTDKRVSRPIQTNNGPVKLFWFSQTIGHGRGLEEVMKMLELLEPGTYELHLLGNSDPLFKIPKNKGICCHAPIPSGELINFASQFDIGLATETGIPLNRNICLTNKIFTYIQAGLCVIASDTTAQTQLLGKYPGVGKAYQKNNPKSLVDVLLYYHQYRNKLLEARTAAFEVGQNVLNWENESKKMLRLLKHTLTGK